MFEREPEQLLTQITLKEPTLEVNEAETLTDSINITTLLKRQLYI